jgi:hypothetical protein
VIRLGRPTPDDDGDLMSGIPADRRVKVKGRAAVRSEIPFFHWSPASVRPRIEHDGFLPGSWSLGREWRPPYVCFSDNPQTAWNLSGDIHPEIRVWDLWQTWSYLTRGYEIIFDHYLDKERGWTEYAKEYRVYDRIWKRNIWFVATRDVTSV